MKVPEVLLSRPPAHRAAAAARALRVTRERRPDLLERAGLTENDLRLIDAGDDEL